MLSEEEPKSFLSNLEDACRFERLRHVLRLLLLTLQRRGEFVAAEWREFDFKEKIWTIPAEHTKTGTGQVVPLADWAIEELTMLKALAGNSRFVLPNFQRGWLGTPRFEVPHPKRCAVPEAIREARNRALHLPTTCAALVEPFSQGEA